MEFFDHGAGSTGRLAQVDFHNTTALSSARLKALIQQEVNGWAVGPIMVRVRYSRGADFSGTCFYNDRRIYINLGRHLIYPYRMATHLARAKTAGRRWYKPMCTIELRDGYQVVLFIFMHELYHLLVKRAKRNTRQKESMCDRFAARCLVDRFGAVIRTDQGEIVPREDWDFQDLEGFVAAARASRVARRPIAISKPRSLDATGRTIPCPNSQPPKNETHQQLLLFPV